MAKTESTVCDYSGEVIPEGEEVTLFIDFKGERKTFHMTESALESLAPYLPQPKEE